MKHVRKERLNPVIYEFRGNKQTDKHAQNDFIGTFTGGPTSYDKVNLYIRNNLSGIIENRKETRNENRKQ